MKLKFWVAILALVSMVGSAVPSVSAAPYCGITWGSTAKTAADTGTGEVVTNARAGRHDCYDRFVVDLSAARSGYDVRYVTAVYPEGEGPAIPLSGGAKLQVVVKSPAYNDNGTPTYSVPVGAKLPGIDLTGYRTLKDAKFAGSFEGQTSFGLGVRARLPFRAFFSTNHVVVDIAHQW
jgi:hypothetical protein